MKNPFNGKLFTGGQSRTQRTVSLPSEVDDVLGRRLKALGMTFQEYVASLVSYDLWAEKPHALTGDACKGHKRSKAAKADEGRLWAEIIASYGKPNKTGSYFEHHVNRQRGVEPTE